MNNSFFFYFFAVVLLAFIVGIFIFVLIKVGLNKNYKPKFQVSPDKIPDSFGISYLSFATRLDFLLQSIVGLLTVFIAIYFLWLEPLYLGIYEELVQWLVLISLLSVGVLESFVIIKSRVKNPVGVAQTMEIKKKGSGIRITFFFVIGYCFLFLLLGLLRYYGII